VIAERLGDDAGAHTARVLAASVAAAIRIALEGWLQPSRNAGAAGSLATAGLVLPTGSLTDQLRAALAPLAPAFDTAERDTQP
jgi:Ca2+/H+ antiporter